MFFAGVLPFTDGDALIYGYAISSEGGLDCVRPLMVVPTPLLLALLLLAGILPSSGGT
jgi:hypothetical protein